jgi:hypothetical protein
MRGSRRGSERGPAARLRDSWAPRWHRCTPQIFHPLGLAPSDGSRPTVVAPWGHGQPSQECGLSRKGTLRWELRCCCRFGPSCPSQVRISCCAGSGRLSRTRDPAAADRSGSLRKNVVRTVARTGGSAFARGVFRYRAIPSTPDYALTGAVTSPYSGAIRAAQISLAPAHPGTHRCRDSGFGPSASAAGRSRYARPQCAVRTSAVRRCNARPTHEGSNAKTLRTVGSSQSRGKSRHSRGMVPITRSQIAFAFELLNGERRIVRPNDQFCTCCRKCARWFERHFCGSQRIPPSGPT